MLKKLHHVAYRCLDAKETVSFYTELLGLKFAAAVAEDSVPSTGEECPFIHIFFEMADGSYIAFFETPQEEPPQKDPNTPAWVQHLALEVESMEEMSKATARLEAAGVETIGPIDHGITQSVYFFDPNGHRLEMAVITEAPGFREEAAREAPGLLADWERRRMSGDWSGKVAARA